MTRYNKILTSFFCLFISTIMVLGTITPDIVFSENENRYLSQWPSFSIESLVSGEYTKQFEEYVTDQFYERDFWVGMKSTLEYLIGKKENNGVYFGKDEYLIDIISNLDYTRIDKNISYLNLFSQKISKPLYFLSIPNTGAIHADKLPKHADINDSLNAYQYINDNLTSNIKHVDTLENLLKNNDEYLYYRTDHHFTTLGAYYTYVEIIKAMGITPYAQNDFDIKTVSDSFYGTMYSQAKAYWVAPDSINIYDFKGDIEYHVTINDGGTIKEMDDLYSWEALNNKDQYALFLDGNHSQVIVKSNIKNNKKLLVLKDSFAHSVVPLLANHFSEIHMLDLRYYKDGITEYVAENNIDDVIVLYNLDSFCKDTNLSWLNS